MEMIEPLITFLGKIPNVVWAAVIASLLTLSGVLLTNRGNNQRLREQLAHDARQRDREREMALRREVYLEAAETMTRAIYVLNNLPNTNLQTPDWSVSIVDMAESSGKIQIVGSDKTIEAVSRFSMQLSKTLLHIASKKIPLDIKKSTIDNLENSIANSSAECGRLVTLMKEYNLSGQVDQAVLNRTNSACELEQNQIINCTQKLAEIRGGYNKGLMELTKECFESSLEIWNLLIPAICAVREELGIPFDEKSFRALNQELQADMKKSLEEFIDQ